MEDITQGFGYWRLDDEEGYLGDFFGFIERDKMLFTETNKDRQPTGTTFNLRFLKGWERKKPLEDDEE